MLPYLRYSYREWISYYNTDDIETRSSSKIQEEKNERKKSNFWQRHVNVTKQVSYCGRMVYVEFISIWNKFWDFFSQKLENQKDT